MRDALMALFWRRQINPTDGRVGLIADELAQMSPFMLHPTHYYIKVLPISMEELDWLSEQNEVAFTPFPFAHEITGTGTIAHAPAEFDEETGLQKIIGSLTPSYGVIPINYKMPDGTKYEILAELYMPHLLTPQLADAAHTPYISKTFADILIDQALYVSGAKTMDELLKYKDWYPSGSVEIYDTVLGEYVALPHVRVHACANGKDVWAYTDQNGKFTINQKLRGPVDYYIEWGSDEYKIFDSSGQLATYFCGRNMNGSLYLQIHSGEAYCIGTISRALYAHYYGSTNIWERISDFRHKNYRFWINYYHSFDPEKSGNFHYPHDKNVSIWGKNSLGEVKGSESLMHTTFHEFGHAAMWYRSVDNSTGYKNFDKTLRESWADFIGWFRMMAEYKKLGLDMYSYFYIRHFDFENGIAPYYERPSFYNNQNVTQIQFQNGEHYTPLFIDLVDGTNQKFIYEVIYKDNENIYPNDNIQTANYKKLYEMATISQNMKELKSNLLMHAAELGVDQRNIHNYFEFYGE